MIERARGMKRETVWVIANWYVCEPDLGQLKGTVREVDLSQCDVTHYTQAEIDEMMENYRQEFGYYPDT
jgi:hypothetical protein